MGKEEAEMSDGERGGGGQIKDANGLSKALDAEIGKPEGYLQTAYRKWCLKHTDLIVRVGEGGFKQHPNGDDSGLLEAIHTTTDDIFDELLKDPKNKPEQKNDAKSRLLREQGNESYKCKKLHRALKLYTKSACAATLDGGDLALAFANRSAVLFQLKEYSCCLQDIVRAVESGYPEKSKRKLLERKVRSLVNLGAIEDARNVLNSSPPLPSHKELKALLEKCSSNGKSCRNAASKPRSERVVQKLPNPNPAFPALASCVRVCHSADKGRHLRASRNIRAGELLCSEDAAAATPASDAVGVLCQNCLLETPNPVPSTISTEHVFCSRDCLEIATSTYHGTEAALSKVLDRADLRRAEWILALRLLLKRNASYYIQNYDDFSAKYDPAYGTTCTEEKPYLTNDFKSLYNLATIRERWSVESHLFKAFVVSFLLRVLDAQSKYLEGLSPEDRLKIGHVLTHFMEITSVNAHEVGIYQIDNKNNNEPSNQRQLGMGQLKAAGVSVEPTLVLANHACEEPSLLRVNVGGSGTLAFAARDIKEGEEITDSYLPLGQSMSVDVRRSELMKKYYFHCQCEACGKNWPPANMLPRGLHDVKPSQFKFPLEDIRRMQLQFAKIQKLGVAINESQKTGDHSKSLCLAVDFLKALEETVDRPHQFYLMAAKTLATALWCIHGSKSVYWNKEDVS